MGNEIDEKEKKDAKKKSSKEKDRQDTKRFLTLIWLKFVYLVKKMLFLSVLLLLFLVAAMKIDEAGTSAFGEAVIGVVLFGLILYLYFVRFHNAPNPLCTYEVDGKLVDHYEFHSYTGDLSYDTLVRYGPYSVFAVIEYNYRNKKYRKTTVLLDEDDLVCNRGKVKLKICRFWPGMMHIEKPCAPQNPSSDNI